jgi:ribosome biogenesis GTPase
VGHRAAGEAREVTFEAVVARVDLTGVVALDDRGALWFATVRGRLQDPGGRLGNAIVVGDRVTVTGGAEPVIEDIAPRENRFERAAAGQSARGRVQITAANLDQVLAIASIVDPPLSEGLLDRFAVACEFLGLPLLIAFSKIDLADASAVTTARETYGRAGYPTFAISAPHGRGIEALSAALEGRRTLVIGHSGVGKSTLLAALVPGLDVRVGAVNAKTGKGRHTTSAATLVRLDPGPPPTELIDTPGVRTFGLPPVELADLPRLFPEWRGRGPCRFADCTHQKEPDCAMKAALDEGAIGADRYRSYLKLREELERDRPGGAGARAVDPRKSRS